MPLLSNQNVQEATPIPPDSLLVYRFLGANTFYENAELLRLEAAFDIDILKDPKPNTLFALQRYFLRIQQKRMVAGSLEGSPLGEILFRCGVAPTVGTSVENKKLCEELMPMIKRELAERAVLERALHGRRGGRGQGRGRGRGGDEHMEFMRQVLSNPELRDAMGEERVRQMQRLLDES